MVKDQLPQILQGPATASERSVSIFSSVRCVKMVASTSVVSLALPSAAPKLRNLGLEMWTPILHKLDHRYSRQILTRKSCDFCRKSMYIVGLRCKQCNLKCHRKCAMRASSQCLLTVNGHSFTNLRDRRALSHNIHRSEKHEHFESPCACVRQKPRPVLHRQHSITSPDSPMSPISPAITPCTCIPPCATSTPIRRNDIHAFNFNMVHSMPSSPSGTQSSQASSSSCGYYSSGSEYNVSVVDSVTGTTSCTCGCQKRTNRLSQSDKRTRWCGGKARTIDVSSTNKNQSDSEEMRSSLISTWPRDFFSHPHQSNEDVPNSIEDAQRICDWMKIDTTPSSSDQSAREAVKEWSIPYENLKFRKCIRRGTYCNEYRGQWHGDVIIHTREVQTEDDFLEEVSMLSKIRHENIALFMGACIDAPNFCVVTSIQRGMSLYDRIHKGSRENRLPLNSRVHIARQIAQGMGYLHAKGIVVGCLNSKNIYLESKVKVCMTGHETVDSPCKSDTHACLPKGHITYLAPELLRRAKVTPPTITIDTIVNQECDIYAFGTVLYELLAQSWPFRHSTIEGVIYQVCSGSRQSVSHIKSSASLKDLITECWAHNQMERPVFSSIMKDLQENAALVNMNRSRSEPENLNKLGLPARLW